MLVAGGAVVVGLVIAFVAKSHYQLFYGDDTPIVDALRIEMEGHWTPTGLPNDIRRIDALPARRRCAWHEIFLPWFYPCTNLTAAFYAQEAPIVEAMLQDARKTICAYQERRPWDMYGDCEDGVYQGRVFVNLYIHSQKPGPAGVEHSRETKRFWLGGS